MSCCPPPHAATDRRRPATTRAARTRSMRLVHPPSMPTGFDGRRWSPLLRRLNPGEVGHDLLGEEGYRAQRLAVGDGVEVDLQRGDLEAPVPLLELDDLLADLVGRADPRGALGSLGLEGLVGDAGDDLVVAGIVLRAHPARPVRG